jgi:hypothetical protein
MLSRDLLIMFFHQTTSPSPEFFLGNIEELFVFVIGSQMYPYSPPVSRDSLQCIHLRAPRMNIPGSQPKLVYKKTCWWKIHQGVKTPLPFTLGILYSLVYLSVEKNFCKPDLMLFPNTARSRLPGVLITGESRLCSVFTTVQSRLRWIHHRGVKIPWCIHHRGVILPILETYNNL